MQDFFCDATGKATSPTSRDRDSLPARSLNYVRVLDRWGRESGKNSAIAGQIEPVIKQWLRVVARRFADVVHGTRLVSALMARDLCQAVAALALGGHRGFLVLAATQ